MGHLRRSMLYVPGNNPGMVKDAGIYGADCILFDLEDSVSINEKDSARFLVYEALSHIAYPSETELLVRINDPNSNIGKLDLEAIVKTGKAVIRLPKTGTKEDVINCATYIEEIERANNIPLGFTKMMAAVEDATGVLNAVEIATASPRMIAIAIGAEDYTAAMKTSRTKKGTELFFARNMVLHAARHAGIDAIDTIFSDVNDEEGFIAEVELIKQLGFDGKSIINPRQIRPLHEIYAPTEKEILRSLAIMEALAEAEKNGSGVVALNGKMIDKPVAIKAQRILDYAGDVRVKKVREQNGIN